MNKYQVLTAAKCVSGRKKELLFILAEIKDGMVGEDMKGLSLGMQTGDGDDGCKDKDANEDWESYNCCIKHSYYSICHVNPKTTPSPKE